MSSSPEVAQGPQARCSARQIAAGLCSRSAQPTARQPPSLVATSAPKTRDGGPRVRRSVRELQADYDEGKKKPLEDLLRAFLAIQKLPADDPQSYFALAGLHGAPLDLRPEVDALSDENAYVYWGGWCHHGNVLFPTWHRLYTLKLEEALRAQVPDVVLPYWDQTSEASVAQGIPAILTQERVMLDGKLVDNPLFSFTLPVGISDEPAERNGGMSYAKPAGYTTVRYPLSGLAGTSDELAEAERHNARFRGRDTTALLNENIVQFIRGPQPQNYTGVDLNGLAVRYRRCLEAPNYTVFSNTTSAQQYNLSEGSEAVVPLEAPHDSMHLAIGGFTSLDRSTVAGVITGANGDMGENNTAAMDPIFFFHHCYVDYLFWLWQERHDKKEQLDIIEGFAGTSSSDMQGPTPGMTPGEVLTMQTPLLPWTKDDGTAYTSEDVVDIRQLGYTFSRGSLDPFGSRDVPALQCKWLLVQGIDRSLFKGSFFIHAFAFVEDAPDDGSDKAPANRLSDVTTADSSSGSGAEHSGKEYYLGARPVLSRFNVRSCRNCLTRLKVDAQFPLAALSDAQIGDAAFRIVIQHRGAELPEALSYSVTVDGKPVKGCRSSGEGSTRGSSSSRTVDRGLFEQREEKLPHSPQLEQVEMPSVDGVQKTLQTEPNLPRMSHSSPCADTSRIVGPDLDSSPLLLVNLRDRGCCIIS